MSLALHEARLIGRRVVWPASLVLHAAAVSMFVSLWGPTGGVPLWQATVLQQLAAMDRLAAAVLLTWLSTFVLTDDEDGRRNLADWSALTARPAPSIFRARIAAIVCLAIVFVAVTLPAFFAAAELSAAPGTSLAAEIGAAAGFAVLCLGITAIAAIALDVRVGVWITAMSCAAVAAVAIRALDTTVARAVTPALIGALLLVIAPLGATGRRVSDGR
jgi:hypothetical protein